MDACPCLSKYLSSVSEMDPSNRSTRVLIYFSSTFYCKLFCLLPMTLRWYLILPIHPKLRYEALLIDRLRKNAKSSDEGGDPETERRSPSPPSGCP